MLPCVREPARVQGPGHGAGSGRITFLDGSNSRRRLYQAGGDEFFYQLEDEDVYVRLAAGRYVANRYWVADNEAPAGPPPRRENIVALEMLSGKPTAPGDED